MANTYDLLIPHSYYHLYNRAVGNEKMFLSNENYQFLLDKIVSYTSNIANIYAYCLMPNHFHFFVKIKSEEQIRSLYQEKKKKEMPLNDAVLMSEFIMEQYSNCFNSYTKSFNKVYNRMGKLFMDHLHRKLITDEAYYTKIIHYIHCNPTKDNIVANIQDWRYSSYNALISNASTKLPRTEILDWFGGRDNFIKFHIPTEDAFKDLEGF